MNLTLIDTSALIYRAYFAIPSLVRASDGLNINAVYGVSQTVWSLLAKAKLGDVTHIAAIFDHPGKNFRHQIFQGYKAHRPQRPSPLASQIPLVRSTIEAFGIPTLDTAGFEADDLIATYAREATRRGWNTLIVSIDKDMLQLVNDNVSILDISSWKVLGRDYVIDRYAVPPEKLTDFQALMGDTADNVPGIPGIGPKRAAALINESGDLESVLARAAAMPGKFNRHVTTHADAARLSKRLVVLADVPMDIPLEWLNRRTVDYRELVNFLTDYECLSLARQVSEYAGLGVLGG